MPGTVSCLFRHRMPTTASKSAPGAVLVGFGEFLYLGARRKLF